MSSTSSDVIRRSRCPPKSRARPATFPRPRKGPAPGGRPKPASFAAPRCPGRRRSRPRAGKGGRACRAPWSTRSRADPHAPHVVEHVRKPQPTSQEPGGEERLRAPRGDGSRRCLDRRPAPPSSRRRPAAHSRADVYARALPREANDATANLHMATSFGRASTAFLTRCKTASRRSGAFACTRMGAPGPSESSAWMGSRSPMASCQLRRQAEISSGATSTGALYAQASSCWNVTFICSADERMNSELTRAALHEGARPMSSRGPSSSADCL